MDPATKIKPSLLLVLLWAFLVPGAGSAQVLAVDGRVSAIENGVVRIDLVGARTAYLGTPVHIFERKHVGDHVVDVRIATLRAWKGQSNTLYAVARFGDAIPPLVVAERLAVVDWPRYPAFIDIAGATSDVDVSWGGHPLGKTPLVLEVFPDAFPLRFSKPCYEPTHDTIVVPAGGSESVGPSLLRASTPRELLQQGEREHNGIEDQNARAAKSLLTSALNERGCGGELDAQERTHAEYLLETVQTRIDLVEFATAQGKNAAQIQDMLNLYAAVRRSVQSIRPAQVSEATRGHIETLHDSMGRFPPFSALHQTYIEPFRVEQPVR